MEEPALTTAHPKTRRHFLDLLLGASVLGWLVSFAYPIIRYLKPLPQTGPTGPTRLTREEAGKLDEKKFVIVPVSGQRVIVLQAPDQKLFAFSAKCTHEGCTITYQPALSGHAAPGIHAAQGSAAREPLDGLVLSRRGHDVFLHRASADRRAPAHV